MQKAGGSIALIGGIVALLIDLLIGRVSWSLASPDSWAGAVCAVLVIILAAICFGAQRKVAGVLLILASVAGAVLGRALPALFLLLSLVGGILAVIGTRKAHVAAVYPAPEPPR